MYWWPEIMCFHHPTQLVPLLLSKNFNDIRNKHKLRNTFLMIQKHIGLVCLFVLLVTGAQAQKGVLVFGVIRDSLNRPITDVNVSLIGGAEQTISNEQGYYQL